MTAPQSPAGSEPPPPADVTPESRAAAGAPPGPFGALPSAAIALVELTEANLPDLLEAAVAGADPLEVMPPVSDPPGWTAERRAAFLAFHRGRALHREHPVERTFVITVDGVAVGAARLEPHGEDVEAGMWIGRAHRGLGIGRIVAARLRELAAESTARRLTAVTTTDNIPARRLLEAGTRTRIDRGEVSGSADLT
ncbi:GNAT family N-acetyltransferase [Nocardia puris]|uniref:GNAT family N-acetyltransferase n=1 Tax=Nocardia puris TaxID=208602 RepID=UPI0018958316|nr:GNAT family N-acetyltransferase [Nocardia puris]MBF6210242.1 GNAT family N-acetyltransferase [Nocardia puris]MBF6367318.1 GNAT family N-acetyltransferase [Nocardia puris]MBF6457503.1 GNAT family N-acetyltransferase [Nocardia puris]